MPKAALDLKLLDELIAKTLAEDIGSGDVTTTALLAPSVKGRGMLLARESGVVAGMPVVRRRLATFDKRLRISRALKDGSALESGTVIAAITGPAGPMLTVERTLLNFLPRLSGIATLTRRYVDAAAGAGVTVLDTRKTLPGWRRLSKYAVAVGGGENHRMGLYDQVLIKDNHLKASGLSPAAAVALARQNAAPELRIEVEAETVGDARAAAFAGADIVMLDNMPPARMKKAVAAVRAISPKTTIEASGRVTLRNVAAVARTGVDWISVGALTHSAGALDIALEMETNTPPPQGLKRRVTSQGT